MSHRVSHCRPIAVSRFVTLIAASISVSLFAQPPAPPPQWAQQPPEVSFQHDAHWFDNRWQQMDIGPFLHHSIATPEGAVLKGLAIKLAGEAGVIFDTAQLNYRVIWKGPFLQLGTRRFGLIEKPRLAEASIWSVLPDEAGWARDGRFKPRPEEILPPGQSRGITSLPADWGRYLGFHQHGERIVLHYQIRETEILDSPGWIEGGESGAFSRSLVVGPSESKLHVRVAGAGSFPVLAEGNGTLTTDADGLHVLEIPAAAEQRHYRVLVFPKAPSDADRVRLRESARNRPSASELATPGEQLWNPALSTRGDVSSSTAAYTIDTLTLPFENPWNALFFTAGHDFFSDGRAAICTAHGDVWVVDGIDSQLKNLRWKRFATGLYQPLGLRIQHDKVFVICRDQVVRLHDRNSDGEADYYENFNNQLFVSGGGHEYVACLDTDPEGNFYFIHAITGVMQLSADGTQLRSLADGFRNPNGLGVSPQGMVTASPQEGQWTPASNITVVKEGGYYGYGGPRETPDRPAGYDLPMCYIPRAMDNSSGGQTWVTSRRWGPLENAMLHLSYGQCRLLLALQEDVEGNFQGGTLRFPTDPSDFESGIMRGRFNPTDGQLYVSGLRGWQTRAVRDGCFQRVRYTGAPVILPRYIETLRNGIKLTFSGPLDREAAQDPTNYFAQQWNYAWTSTYGSPEFQPSDPGAIGRDEAHVRSATLLPDNRTLFLEIPDIQPVDQLQITWTIKSANGSEVRQTYAHTIHQLRSESFPESEINRVEPPRLLPPEVEQRLRPQSAFTITESGIKRQRLARLIALRQDSSSAPAGGDSSPGLHLRVDAYIQPELSGYYHFAIESSGNALLAIDDTLYLRHTAEQGLRSEGAPLLLRRGFHPLRIEMTGVQEEVAQLRLLWRGRDFDWEPIPAKMIFHDPQLPGLQDALLNRAGRVLVSDMRCLRCHQTAETKLLQSPPGPSLIGLGNRVTAEWLYEWLLDPSRMRNDIHMPQLLGDPQSMDAQRDAADLTAYLQTLGDPIAEADHTANTTQRDPQLGEELFEKVGCIGCHRLSEPQQPDQFDRISLASVAAKFHSGRIARYLLDPDRHYPQTRMPTFGLTETEALALEAFLRHEGDKELSVDVASGNAIRGKRLFAEKRCVNCHSVERSDSAAMPTNRLAIANPQPGRGCLRTEDDGANETNVPRFAIDDELRRPIIAFLTSGRVAPISDRAVESTAHLIDSLRCMVCHDRDGERAPLGKIVAIEGSGVLPTAPPTLSWTGEKLFANWTAEYLSDAARPRLRPWLTTRMPAFPGYAHTLAEGLALQHGIDPGLMAEHDYDPRLVDPGRELTTSKGLDCRQCHAIGSLQPRGDDKTQVHPGINFSYVRERMRKDYYDRFLLNPARYDPATNMPKLSDDGVTTKVTEILDKNAKAQFNAIWHYIQSGEWP